MTRIATLLSMVMFVAANTGAPQELSAQADKPADQPSQEAQSAKSVRKNKKVVLPVFSLDRPLMESPVVQDPLFGAMGAETTQELLSRLRKAEEDDSVAGVVVLVGNVAMGNGQLEEIYSALRRIRDAGKPVYAHADNLTFGKLALLSSASRISVAPVGELFITGLYGEQPHLRGLLDKIHVTPDFITCGAYKSAAETFMRTEPSPEAARMYDWLFDSLFDNYVRMIADGREKTREEVRGWIDHGLYSAETATKLGIIDAVESRADFVAHMTEQHGEDAKFAKRYGRRKTTTIDFSNPFAAFKIWGELLRGVPQTTGKQGVAIVYVEGPIVPGKPQPSPFPSQGVAYSGPIAKALDKAAADETVKAVVLRVDSPGGSAVASETILQATRRLAAKKPFVVSMGNVAASGGYYVSCGSETIFADAGTITGSIGVVAGKLATQEMWETVGISWHPLQRGKNAGMLYSGNVFTDEQRQNLQSWMDEVYEVFQGHVQTVRGDRLTKPIDQLAGGRVYTGRQALELGLVDRIGSLPDAIQFVAQQAGLDAYDVRVLPKPKSFVELMLSDMAGGTSDDDQLQLDSRWQGERLSLALSNAAAPLLQRLEPRRAAAMRRALLQLEILQAERIGLLAPDIVLAP